MNYLSLHLLETFIILLTASSCSSWQFFTSLSDMTLTNSAKEPQDLHSEYNFGDCRAIDKKETHTRFAHVHLDHMDVLGKIIIRGWIDIPRIPTCIMLKGYSYSYDLFRSTAYNFQLCVPRITYCHTHHRYKYHYYEWYLPKDFVGGMNWDIFFWGPKSMFWQ